MTTDIKKILFIYLPLPANFQNPETGLSNFRNCPNCLYLRSISQYNFSEHSLEKCTNSTLFGIYNTVSPTVPMQDDSCSRRDLHQHCFDLRRLPRTYNANGEAEEQYIAMHVSSFGDRRREASWVSWLYAILDFCEGVFIHGRFGMFRPCRKSRYVALQERNSVVSRGPSVYSIYNFIG